MRMNFLKNWIILHIFIFIMATSFSCAKNETQKTTSDEKADKIDELVSNYTKYGKFNRSILVAEEGIFLKERFWNG